ncbi:MAG TPA: ethanolamine ammonia-lyase reactivating factor EutA [Xanthobacteraceae bacterium]|nr:ethanolamine ammonia-lyase reactivating factor EutA [Xanthobacteraceae bacterium]
MHETDFLHEHAMTEDERAALARAIWSQENIEFRTVGIDIGSSTSHLLFAKVALQRQSQGLSSRFVVIGREIVWRSPILLTPFLPDGTIDAQALGAFIRGCYRDAGIAQSDVDSGAVILTGEAIKRKNARAIDELFAADAGKFVCATAGHKLECRLAAHGSGAVALSKARDACVLHADVGGGTTKLALIDRGTIVGLSAFAVGGRLIAADADGAWTRIDHSAELVADDLKMAISPPVLADPAVRQRIARRLALVAADYLLDAPLDALGQSLLLTERLPHGPKPTAITFSGGVAEYMFGHEQTEFGDVAKLLAGELAHELSRRSALPLTDPGQRIRATVIGASQFTVQVSGKTIYLPDPYVLPVHNVPVVRVDLGSSDAIDREPLAAAIRGGLDEVDLERNPRVAIAFSWRGDPEHSRLKSAGEAILRALEPLKDRIKLLLLMIDGDVGKTLGRILHRELHWPGKIVSIDGMDLHELDYVDVGELIAPPGVVPVVIKSLLFA